jgi:ABC-2 type transport system permease protein
MVLSMRYYAGLYINYWRLFIRVLAQYRADIAIMIGSAAVQEGATLLFIDIIFSNIRQLRGWAFPEVLMVYGLVVMTGGLWNVTLDVPHRIHWYVRSGELDYLLVRPLGVLFQIAGASGLNPTSLGRVAVGIVAVVIAMREQGVRAQWWWALYLPATVVSGVLIFFSLYLLLACLNFWFTNVDSLLTTFAWTAQFGRFPATIFGPVLQFVLTWVLPFAMVGFYPAAFLLRGGEYRLPGLLAPLVGWVFLGLALAFWRVAIRHYQSTGS